jgi:membrane associated rhomboid family serine protease
MSISFIIILITVATSWYGFRNPSMQSRWMLNPYMMVHRKQWYRLISSGFIHGSWVHLLFNMFTFFFFGPVIEYYFAAMYGKATGAVLFVVLYLLSMAAADITTIRKYKNQIHYNALGASGAVAAVVFSSILFDPLNKLCLYAILCLPGFIFAILYLMYSYFQGKSMSDNINHDAHLWGAVVGMAYTIVLWPGIVMHFFDQLKGFSIF